MSDSTAAPAEPLTPEPGRLDENGNVFHGPVNRPEKAPRKAPRKAEGAKAPRKAEGGKAPRRALGGVRAKAPRRPYRGLDSGALQTRLEALRKREDSLRHRHQRAEVTLGRLQAEAAARAEIVAA